MKKILSAILIVLLITSLISCEIMKEPEDGKSAYEIAIENGFEGSEAEWLESLKGKDGQDGENGADGQNGKDGEDGEDGKDGLNGTDGAVGKDGIGIQSTKIDEKGFLIITLTDGSVVNAGYIGVAKEDTSDKEPVLNTMSLNIPEGKPYLLTSDRPDTVFSSSDPSVVQVSPEGLVLALSEGNATVTATARDGKKTECKISVICYDFIKLNDGTLEITGYYGTRKELDIPSDIMEQTVTSIGDSAFADWAEKCSYTSVTLPDSVTSIGDYAFTCPTELTGVTFGKSIESIGNSAFSGCTKLNNVILPDSLTFLGGAAFNGCASLTSIKIPDGITKINGSSFDGCENLTAVEIGTGVEFIGMFAFGSCKKLESIIIPENVKELDEYAFSDCDALTSVTMSQGLIYYFNTFRNTPWFAEFGGNGDNPAIIPDGAFEERDETVYVYATGGANDDHLPNANVNAYIYPYASNWSNKGNEYALENYVALHRIGIYIDDEGYGWSKLEFTAPNGKDTVIYVRNSQLVTELPNNIIA